jgi:hypothetical protein
MVTVVAHKLVSKGGMDGEASASPVTSPSDKQLESARAPWPSRQE